MSKKIVALGGGTGLPKVLKALAADAAAGRVSVTAVVNVVDDGGSSGKIRDLLATLPPGDIRNCLVATARAQNDLIQVFDYRFETSGELDNHSLGNLIIAALFKIESDFSQAVKTASKLLDCWATVVPVTTDLMRLLARTRNGNEIFGQAKVATSYEPIETVFIDPPSPHAHPQALKAISEADFILIGPGSLYSSIIPVILIPEIREAILASPGLKVYLCNTMSHRAENLGYDACEHYEALNRHAGAELADMIVAQDPASFTPQQLADAVQLGAVPVELAETCWGPKWSITDLADETVPVHHSPDKLRSALKEISVI